MKTYFVSVSWNPVTFNFKLHDTKPLCIKMDIKLILEVTPISVSFSKIKLNTLVLKVQIIRSNCKKDINFSIKFKFIYQLLGRQHFKKQINKPSEIWNNFKTMIVYTFTKLKEIEAMQLVYKSWECT